MNKLILTLLRLNSVCILVDIPSLTACSYVADRLSFAANDGTNILTWDHDSTHNNNSIVSVKLQ